MNKMVKGAIATGVGVILLVGGGGTLAVWNQSQDAAIGSVVAGDLNLTADTAQWKNAAGNIDIATYKVVPGDVLTYNQPLTVTLTGNLMQATLTTKGLPAGVNNGFVAENISVETVFTDNSATKKPLVGNLNSGSFKGAAAPVVPTGPNVNATTTFTFKAATKDRSSATKKYDFQTSGFGYTLEQVAP